MVAGEVHHGAFTLAVLVLDRLLQHARPVRAGALAPGIDIGDTHLHDVSDHTRLRRLAFVAHVGDDHRPGLLDVHLRAMVLADPHALHETEGLAEPRHGGAHVGIHQDGSYGGGGGGTVGLHGVPIASHVGPV
jgi:hypothetical protein